MALVLEDVGNDSDFELGLESGSKLVESRTNVATALHGSEALQESFDSLITLTSKSKGWSFIAAPPSIGATSRVKFAVDTIAKRVSEAQHKKALDALKAESNKAAQEWKAVLLKYNEKMRKQEETTAAEGEQEVESVSPVMVDLRGMQSKSEIIAAFAFQLHFSICGSIEAMQQQLINCLLTSLNATVLILDHVMKEACPVLTDIFGLAVSSMGCIMIADLNLNTAQAFPENVPEDVDLLLGNSFVDEVNHFARALAIPWDIENEKDYERVLVFSSVLSSRGAKALASTLMGFAADEVSTPSTPVPFIPQSSSGFFEAQVFNEETRGLFSRLPPEKKSAVVDKINIIAELSGGIPGLIHILNRIELDRLKVIQSLVKSRKLKTKLRMNKFANAGRVYSQLTIVYQALLSPKVLTIPPEMVFTIMTFSAPQLLLNVINAVSTAIPLHLVQKISASDEETISFLTSLGIVNKLQGGDFLHIPRIVIQTLASSKSMVSSEVRSIAQENVLAFLWSEFRNAFAENVIIGFATNNADIAMIQAVATKANENFANFQALMPQLQVFLSTLTLSTTDNIKMMLGIMSLGSTVLLTWLPTKELMATITPWIKTIVACPENELLEIISRLINEVSMVSKKEFFIVESVNMVVKLLYSIWWQNLFDESNFTAYANEFIAKFMALSSKISPSMNEEEDASSMFYSTRLSLLQFQHQFFSQFVNTNETLDRIDKVAIDQLLEEYAVILKRQTTMFLMNLDGNDSTHGGRSISIESLTDAEEDDEVLPNAVTTVSRNNEPLKRMDNRLNNLRSKLDVEINDQNKSTSNPLIGPTEISDLMTLAVVDSTANIYSFAAHWLLRILLRRKHSIAGVQLPFAGRLLRSLNLAEFVVMNANDDLRVYEYLHQLVCSDENLNPKPFQHVLETVAPLSPTAAEQEAASLFITSLLQLTAGWHYRAYKELSKLYSANSSLVAARQSLLYCDSISFCHLFEVKYQPNERLATYDGLQDAKQIADSALAAVSKDLSPVSVNDWSQRLMLGQLYALVGEFSFAISPSSGGKTNSSQETASITIMQKAFAVGRCMFSSSLRFLYGGQVAIELLMMITSLTHQSKAAKANNKDEEDAQEVFIPPPKLIEIANQLCSFLNETCQSAFKQDTLTLQRLFLIAIDSHGSAVDKTTLTQTLSRMVLQQQLIVFAVCALGQFTQYSSAITMLKQVLSNIRTISDTIYATETADIAPWNSVVDGLFDDLVLLREREEEARKVEEEHQENAVAVEEMKRNNHNEDQKNDEKDLKIEDANKDDDDNDKNEEETFKLAFSSLTPYSLTMYFADGLYLLSELIYSDSLVRYRLEPGISKEIATLAFEQYFNTTSAALEVYANDLSLKRHCAIALCVLRDVAKRQVAQRDFNAATKTHEEILKLFLTAKFTTMLTLAQCYHEYGEMLMEKKEYFHASLMFQMAVDNYRDFDTTLVTDDGLVQHEMDRLYLLPNLRNWSEEQQKELIAASTCYKAKACLGNEDWEGAQENAELALHILEEMVATRAVGGSMDRADNIVSSASNVDDDVPEEKDAGSNNAPVDRRTLVIHSNVGIDTYTVLGLIHYHFEELTEAAEYYNKARTALTRLGRDESLEMAKVLHNIGILLHSEGKLDEAQASLSNAMRILVKRYSNTAVYQLASTLEALQAIYSEKGDEKEVDMFEKYADDIEERLNAQEARRIERTRALQRELSGLVALDQENDKKIDASKTAKDGDVGLVDRIRSALFGFLGPAAADGNGGITRDASKVSSSGSLLLRSPRTPGSPRPVNNVELLVVDDPPVNVSSGPYKLDPNLFNRPPARSARSSAASMLRESLDEEDGTAERGPSFDFGGKISKQKRATSDNLNNLQPLSNRAGNKEEKNEVQKSMHRRKQKEELPQHQGNVEEDELPSGNCVVC